MLRASIRPTASAWLVFGSWWDGIKMREIDPETGMLIEGNDTLYSLASRKGGGGDRGAVDPRA